jgi:hypothetical protein
MKVLEWSGAKFFKTNGKITPRNKIISFRRGQDSCFETAHIR